jgi:hypothetical protein
MTQRDRFFIFSLWKSYQQITKKSKTKSKIKFYLWTLIKNKIMVYKFRVILDAEEDIFRDIAILMTL